MSRDEDVPIFLKNASMGRTMCCQPPFSFSLRLIWWTRSLASVKRMGKRFEPAGEFTQKDSVSSLVFGKRDPSLDIVAALGEVPVQASTGLPRNGSAASSSFPWRRGTRVRYRTPSRRPVWRDRSARPAPPRAS